MSWWDYGYQITAMANRTVIVDNNTWNNTHISRVGQVSNSLKFLFSLHNNLTVFSRLSKNMSLVAILDSLLNKIYLY